MSEGDKRTLQQEDQSSKSLLIYGLHFWLIFKYNTAIESHEHVDYAGLKNDSSRANDIEHWSFRCER